MSIVLSHTTAKAVYQAAHSASAKDTEPCNPAAIYGSCPTGTLLDAAAEWLTKHDVSLDAIDCLEVMVFDRRNARYAMNCQCHVSSKRFSSSRFIELKDGIFIVGVELCALQAATYLPFRDWWSTTLNCAALTPLEPALPPRITSVSRSPRPKG